MQIHEDEEKNSNHFEFLNEIGLVLERNQVEWWLDSGTLLGIVRDGGLILSDHDVDISAWFDDALDFNRLSVELSALGYVVRPEFYQGKPYKFWMTPKHALSEMNQRSVDLRFFWNSQNQFAYSPRIEWVFRHFGSKTPRPIKNLVKLVPQGGWRIWQTGLRGRVPVWWIKHLKPVATVHTWWVPLGLLRERLRLDNELWVPARFHDYLEYRYGDWRTPQHEWNFKTDDGSYVWRAPEEILVDYKI